MTQKQKIITVFGGTGFLGRHAIYALAKTGAQIRVASRVKQRAYFLRPAGDVGQIVPIRCDVHDTASVAAALQGATHAINLIGTLFEKDKKNRFDALHRDVPRCIAEQAQEAGLQMLMHVSALGAAPDSPSHYGRSKAAGEDAALKACANTVILRPSILFGPDDDFFNRFARMARLSPCLPLISGGTTKFQPVYVGDVAKAIRNVIACPYPGKYQGHTYELGGPEVFTFKQLLEMMQKFTGQDRALVSLPAPIAKTIGVLSAFLPRPVITVDQVNSLKKDSIESGHYPDLQALGVAPTALAAILPGYLGQYKKIG